MSDIRWIGVDLGGTKVLAGVFDDQLKLLGTAKQPSNASGGPSAVFESTATAVQEALAKTGTSAEQVKGLGFGVPGQIDVNRNVVRYAPNLDWRHLDVSAHLPKSWSWPVVLHNDTRMATYGEFACGAAKGAKNVFGIFVGTGVGGGLILNGELYAGYLGHAGEIGHVVMHWRKGHTLESIAGRKYQMKRAEKLLEDAPKRVRKEWKGVDLEKVKSSQLAEFYQKDDPIAVQLIDDAARAVGASIGSMINLLSPEVVVIGGGVTEALKETFTERVWEFATRVVLPNAADGVKFVHAGLGDDAGITGCAAYARNRLGNS
ncbi:MAG: ROK family protein [Gemmataceae bacterium]